MGNDRLLHILRNPYGWAEEDVRQARQQAADILERAIVDAERYRAIRDRLGSADLKELAGIYIADQFDRVVDAMRGRLK